MDMKTEGQRELSENDKKKKYLNSYNDHVRRIHRINSEIAEIRLMKIAPSLNCDGMPHGSSNGDLSGYAAKIDQMEEELLNERYGRIITYQHIAKIIMSLKNENEKDVLFYRYIKGMEWYEIAEKMKYTERHVTRIHGKALKNIKIPKDVLECPIDK